MKKLLFVNCCLRGEASRTLLLCRDYLAGFAQRMSEKGEAWTIEELDLAEEDILVQDAVLAEKSAQLIRQKKFEDPMFRYASQLIAADQILIGAPYWDLDFPAKLKVYLERCSVSGLTFLYDRDGTPYGQCRAERVVYITTAGGTIGKLNFGFEYVKGLFQNLLGVEQAEFIAAEALDIIGNDVDAILKETKNTIKQSLANL